MESLGAKKLLQKFFNSPKLLLLDRCMKGEKGIEKKVSVSSGEGPDIVQIHVCLSFVPKNFGLLKTSMFEH